MSSQARDMLGTGVPIHDARVRSCGSRQKTVCACLPLSLSPACCTDRQRAAATPVPPTRLPGPCKQQSSMIGQYGGGACLGRALRRSRGVLVLQAVEVYVRDLCVDPVALHVVRRLQRRAHGALERDLRPRRVRPSRAGGRSARQRCVKSKQKYKVSGGGGGPCTSSWTSPAFG